MKQETENKLGWITSALIALIFGFYFGKRVDRERIAEKLRIGEIGRIPDMLVTIDSVAHVACYMRETSRAEMGCIVLDSTNTHAIGR